MHDLALKYIREVKRFQARHDHDTDFFRLARAEGILVTPGKRNTYLPGEPAVIMVESGLYSAAAGRRIGLHELAHHIALTSGIEDDVHDLHEDWPGVEETIEAMCQVGAIVLQLPDPMLTEARRRYGDTAAALAHLSRVSGAPLPAVLRRWVYAEEDASRAAWVSSGSVIVDAAAQYARLPFWTNSRVPEVAQVIPHASLQKHHGRVLGVVGW